LRAPYPRGVRVVHETVSAARPDRLACQIRSVVYSLLIFLALDQG